MRALRRAAAGVTIAASAVAAGCSFAPAPRTPESVAEMPAEFPAATAGGDYRPLGWWTAFDDPVLDRLVETAVGANLDLREATARLEELRYRYRIAHAAAYPSISASADVTRSSTPSNTGLGSSIGGDADSTGTGISFVLPDRFDFTTYSASLGFAYEVDFWGRVRNESVAAVHDFLASRADLETARITVIGATVSTYFEIVTLRRQLALAEENVDLLRERSELTADRYRRGLAGSFELYTIRALYRDAQSEVPLVRTQLDDAEGRLAVLLGRFAGRLGDLLPSDLEPAVPTTRVPATLPAALLENRPDVVAAAERMASARLRVGARRAERLPTLTLNGSVGLQSSQPDELFRVDQWFLNLVGGIFTPLFQGGRLRANVGVAEAQYDQALVAYARAVLTAYSEVRTSLGAFDHELERHARVLDRVSESEASYQNQLARYRRGVGDYVSYLDARRDLVAARTAYAEATRGLAEARLAIHRALGGAWIEDPDAPAAASMNTMGSDPGPEDR